MSRSTSGTITGTASQAVRSTSLPIVPHTACDAVDYTVIDALADAVHQTVRDTLADTFRRTLSGTLRGSVDVRMTGPRGGLHRALTIREKVFGPDHFSVAEVLDGLARVCCQTGRTAEAPGLSAGADTVTRTTTKRPGRAAFPGRLYLRPTCESTFRRPGRHPSGTRPGHWARRRSRSGRAPARPRPGRVRTCGEILQTSGTRPTSGRSPGR